MKAPGRVVLLVAASAYGSSLQETEDLRHRFAQAVGLRPPSFCRRHAARHPPLGSILPGNLRSLKSRPAAPDDLLNGLSPSELAAHKQAEEDAKKKQHTGLVLLAIGIFLSFFAQVVPTLKGFGSLSGPLILIGLIMFLVFDFGGPVWQMLTANNEWVDGDSQEDGPQGTGASEPDELDRAAEDINEWSQKDAGARAVCDAYKTMAYVVMAGWVIFVFGVLLFFVESLISGGSASAKMHFVRAGQLMGFLFNSMVSSSSSQAAQAMGGLSTQTLGLLSSLPTQVPDMSQAHAHFAGAGDALGAAFNSGANHAARSFGGLWDTAATAGQQLANTTNGLTNTTLKNTVETLAHGLTTPFKDLRSPALPSPPLPSPLQAR